MLEALVRKLLRADSTPAADSARSELEQLFAPIQVLKPGAEEVARLVIAGLPEATSFGKVDAWMLLVQLGAGALEPTPADHNIVCRVRGELLRVIPQAIEILDHERYEDHPSLIGDVFDVLDLIQCAVRQAGVFEILPAFERFADKGATQRRKVDAVLGDYSSAEPE